MKIYKDLDTTIWHIGDYTNVGLCGYQIVGDSVRIYSLEDGKEYFYGPINKIIIVRQNDGIDDNLYDVADLKTVFDGYDIFRNSTLTNTTLTDVVNYISYTGSTLVAAIQDYGSTMYKSFSVEITRPANQTPYTAGDVIADTTAAFIPFANVSRTGGSGVKIVRVRIQTDDTSVAGTKFNLHLYKDEPTFIADNAAFAVAYANATKRIGAIPVVMGTGNLGTVGMNDYNIAMCNPASRSIYFILETVNGFTPSANSTKFTVTIDCELSNI